MWIVARFATVEIYEPKELYLTGLEPNINDNTTTLCDVPGSSYITRRVMFVTISVLVNSRNVRRWYFLKLT